MNENRELTDDDLERSIGASVRRRLARGEIVSKKDITDLRKMLGVSTEEFAKLLGVGHATLIRWETSDMKPTGPALQLVRLAASEPRAFMRLRDG